MSLLSCAARRRVPHVFPLPISATAAPWNSSTVPCVIPTYDGVGATIHPSVVDMGAAWNGYRWWMANTPYANEDDVLENPCIWGSNDRRTWHVPAGVTNPLEPWPGGNRYHSDVELVYDPDSAKLTCLYRLTSNTAGITTLRAATSPNGRDWTLHGDIHTLTAGQVGGTLSPTVTRVGQNAWRMWAFGRSYSARLYSATSVLGPWVDEGPVTRLGATFTGWHGDIIWHGDRWLAIYSDDPNKGRLRAVSSLDGVTWSGEAVVTNGPGGGWDDRIYRPTIAPSTEPGYVDCWYSGYGDVPGTCATDYVRLPISLWPAPPA